MIDKTLGFAVSVSLHLLLIACLSFIVFYTEKNESSYMRAGITELDIPKLNIPTEEVVSRASNARSTESMAEASVSKSTPIMTELQLQSPAAAFFQSSPSTAAMGFGDGFARLAISAATGNVRSGGPYSREAIIHDKERPALTSKPMP